MAASRLDFRIARLDLKFPSLGGRLEAAGRRRRFGFWCSRRKKMDDLKSVEKTEEWKWRLDSKRMNAGVRVSAAVPPIPSLFASKKEKFYWRCTPRNSRPQSRTKRDTGIANEKDWEIDLLSENVNESGTNEDGSSWFRESGEDLGENGYTCRWTWMGGLEKSGRNVDGDSWWETWREVLYQDELRWEKYNAKGWSEKGAHKYGRLNKQCWWENRTNKWAGAELRTKWGDKWEEKFFSGIAARQGENWHVSPGGERWSRTWGEEHFGNGTVHKYGESTTGKSWDIIMDVKTCYEAKPHYGWADVVGNSTQLLSIQPRERPSGFYSNLDLILAPPPPPADPLDPAPSPFQ